MSGTVRSSSNHHSRTAHTSISTKSFTSEFSWCDDAIILSTKSRTVFFKQYQLIQDTMPILTIRSSLRITGATVPGHTKSGTIRSHLKPPVFDCPRCPVYGRAPRQDSPSIWTPCSCKLYIWYRPLHLKPPSFCCPGLPGVKISLGLPSTVRTTDGRASLLDIDWTFGGTDTSTSIATCSIATLHIHARRCTGKYDAHLLTYLFRSANL